MTFVGYSLSSGSSSGRSSGSGNEIPAVFLGDSKYVVQGDGGWTTPSALSTASSSSSNSNTSSGRTRGTGGSGGGMTTLAARRQSQLRAAAVPQTLTSAVSPAPPAGINLPHEELAIIVANYTDLHSDGSIASGSLTEIGVDLLLVPCPAPTKRHPRMRRELFACGSTTVQRSPSNEVVVSAKTGPGWTHG